MESVEIPLECIVPVAILLADVRDVLALGLTSHPLRRVLPPITELTIGSKFAFCGDGDDRPRLHWYSEFEEQAEPKRKLAVLYQREEESYLDAHAVIRRIPPSVAAEITHLSIECYLAPDYHVHHDERRGPAYHAPVMHSYQPSRPDGRVNLDHALRQHGAVFTALRGLEIHHPFRGYSNHMGTDDLADVVLGLCARALVRNTRRTLRHLAFKTKVGFSGEDFQECMFGDLDFLNADLTPFVAVPIRPAPVYDEQMARYQTLQDVLMRTAQGICRNCKRLTVLSIPRLRRAEYNAEMGAYTYDLGEGEDDETQAIYAQLFRPDEDEQF